jgi:glycosyltransferase involved in cell wall biosynthesis
MGKYILAFYNALLGKRIMRKSEQIVAVSNFEATTLINEFKIYPERISIIPLGVDIIDTTKAKKIDNSINLLYVGYLIKRKNVNYVLDALNSLIHEYGMRNVRLSIVGDGPEKHALLKMAKRLDVEDFIKWHSFVSRPELVSIIKGSDILLLLSGSESFGIVVAETLAFGTSVIVTKRAALEEFSGEPGCFIIDNYPPDPQEVAKLIIEICNGEKYVSLSRSSFSNRIRTWGRVADDYNKLYKDIVHC